MDLLSLMLYRVHLRIMFTPLLLEGGLFAGTLGKLFGIGNGRGAGLLISMAGIMLCVTAVILYKIKSIKKLENSGDGEGLCT